MTEPIRSHPAFARLPRRLTISFPLWLLYATPGAYSPYYDIDAVLRAHAERGFNCLRIDSGVGLIHDADGRRRPPFFVSDMFGEYEKLPRQQHVTGDGGPCDLLGRLIEVCTCARRYGIVLILSQWYYLHTYWFHAACDRRAAELFAIPPQERIPVFARFWHYLLQELETRGLDGTIAFVELFNEVNDHPYLCGAVRWGSNRNALTDEEAAAYRAQHEEAIRWLKAAHPQILFAYDAAGPHQVEATLPPGAQVYNFHSYYLWSIYNRTFDAHPEWFMGKVTPEDVAGSRRGRLPAAPDWYRNIARHHDLDPARLGEAEAALEARLADERPRYVELMEKNLAAAQAAAGSRPLVCGEGVSYICSKALLWEERSAAYWSLLEEMIDRYREAGLWGTVIRTCCGPEDPSWTMCQERLLALNRRFLGGEA